MILYNLEISLKPDNGLHIQHVGRLCTTQSHISAVYYGGKADNGMAGQYVIMWVSYHHQCRVAGGGRWRIPLVNCSSPIKSGLSIECEVYQGIVSSWDQQDDQPTNQWLLRCSNSMIIIFVAVATPPEFHWWTARVPIHRVRGLPGHRL